MKNMMRAWISAAAMVMTAGHAAAAQAVDAVAAIEAAVYDNNYWRTEADKARDKARRPDEVLAFFGLRPDMTVVENLPGSGWYTRILGPLLREKGGYLAAQAQPELFVDTVPAEQRERFLATSNAWQKNFIAANAKLVGERARAHFYGVDRGSPAYLRSESVDAVLDIRSVHNLVAAGPERAERIMAEFFRVLRPGGTFGVIDHREDEASPRTPEESGSKGYVKESHLIALATKAGFEFVARSDILSNPKDTRDHEGGVWSLPPTFVLGDKDRAKYAAIGESDRMLIRFVKPVRRQP